MFEFAVLVVLVCCAAAGALYAHQVHIRAWETIEDLLDVEIPQHLAPAPAVAGDRRQEARQRLAERRQARRGRGLRQNDLEARLRAAGVDPAAVDVPEPVQFDVPDELDEGGMLRPEGRELDG
jgi:hypothetical protein